MLNHNKLQKWLGDTVDQRKLNDPMEVQICTDKSSEEFAAARRLASRDMVRPICPRNLTAGGYITAENRSSHINKENLPARLGRSDGQYRSISSFLLLSGSLSNRACENACFFI
jgi:hypothetical protein